MITGVVYAKAAEVKLTGLAAIDLDLLGGAYVADSMTLTGVGGVTIDLKETPARTPDVRLVEREEPPGMKRGRAAVSG